MVSLDCPKQSVIILFMRIALTRYGLPQVVLFPVIIITAMAICVLAGPPFLPAWAIVLIETILAAKLVFCLSFFRDPVRTVPADKDVLLAPADGTIADIETVQEDSFIGGKALRIGIFLSVFNVHINRSPCDVKVEKIVYKKGLFKDARNPMAGKVNESNDLRLVRTVRPYDKLVVRQISGAIARRIVCRVRQGDDLSGGEQFGMIKFGSRTELYMPAGGNLKLMVGVGEKVKAGVTILARYGKCGD